MFLSSRSSDGKPSRFFDAVLKLAFIAVWGLLSCQFVLLGFWMTTRELAALLLEKLVDSLIFGRYLSKPIILYATEPGGGFRSTTVSSWAEIDGSLTFWETSSRY